MPRSARRTYILRLAAVVSLHRCLSPFGKAIIVATALHCVLMAHRWSRFPHSTRSLRPTNGKSTELQIELEGPNLDGYSPASRRLTTADSTAFAQRDLPRKAAVVTGFSAPQAPTSHRIESTEPPHAGLESAPSLAESIPEASLPMSAPTTGPQPKIDLGLNGGLLRMLEAQAGVNPTPKPAMPNRARDSGKDLTRKLNSAILADDVRHGRARGNVLLGALDSALRSVGPTRGRAIIQATVDARGDLSDLVLLRGDSNEWASVLQSFRNQAKNRRVRVPAGAQGLRITFNVSAKVQRPSGKAVESTPIGVDGQSLAPNGMAMRGTFDLADLSNISARMISARIVSEELL